MPTLSVAEGEASLFSPTPQAGETNRTRLRRYCRGRELGQDPRPVENSVKPLFHPNSRQPPHSTTNIDFPNVSHSPHPTCYPKNRGQFGVLCGNQILMWGRTLSSVQWRRPQGRLHKALYQGTTSVVPSDSHKKKRASAPEAHALGATPVRSLTT